MLVHGFLEEWAARRPDDLALIELGRTATYGALDGLANRFANLLRKAGATCGDRVVVALENGIEFVGAYLGTMKAGAIAVPLPTAPRSDRLLRAIADCTPSICLVDRATSLELGSSTTLAAGPTVFVLKGPAIQPLPEPYLDLQKELDASSEDRPIVRRSDLDLAAIMFTSGSTGDPRGVMLSHRNLVVNARSIASYLQLTSTDRVMCVLPFYYVYGLSLLHTHLLVGGSVVIDNRFTFPNVVLEAMQRQQVTGFAGVPSTFALLMHRSNLNAIRLPSLRYVTQAGGAMPAVRILEWLERGPNAAFYVMYGATEAGARLTYLPPEQLRAKLGSIGRPIPDVEILVVRDDGQPAKAGEIGELVARGANISCGYWNNPEETRQSFGPLGYRTGDIGYADEDGYFYLVGRRRDIIKVGAHRVGPKEIEDVMHEHPAIRDAAVVGAPHHLLGEVPVAFVVLGNGGPETIGALHAFCARRLPSHKVPTRIVSCSELPKLSGSGKVDKKSLRELASNLGLESGW